MNPTAADVQDETLRRTEHLTTAWRAVAASLLLLPFVLSSAAAVAAASRDPVAPERAPSWARRHFGADEGAPPAISAIAQTSEGFIWLGTADGLYRFDGITFEHMPSASTKPLQSERVSALLADANGSLWVGHDWGGISLFRAGKHVMISRPAMGSILSMARGADGSSWAISGKKGDAYYWRLEHGTWRAVTSVPLSQFYLSPPAIDRAGTMWVLRDSALWSLGAGQSRPRLVLPKVQLTATLALDSTGHAWLAASGKLKPLPLNPVAPLARGGNQDVPLDTSKVSHLLFTEEGDVWQYSSPGALTRHITGQARKDGRGSSSPGSFQIATAPVDAFIFPPALVDHEKSIWVANNRGLDQFRQTSFVPIKELSLDQPRPAADPLILRDGRGTIWIKRGSKLYRVAEDGSLELQPIRLASSSTPCAAYGAGVWILANHHRIRLYGGERVASFSLAGTTIFEQAPVSSCAEDRAGRLWIQDGGTLRVLDHDRMRAIDLGPDNNTAVAGFAVDRDGRMIASSARGNLWRFDGTVRQLLWDIRDIPVGFVEFLYQGPNYLLLGGDRGLARFDGRRFQMLSSDRLPALSLVGGAFQTPAGDTWLTTIRGVLRLRTSALDRAFSDPGYSPQFRFYSEADGLPGTPSFFNRPNIAADRQGILWVGTSAGVARLDPTNAIVRGGPPNVVLTSVSADGQNLSATSATITLPRQPGRLEVAFTALSFVDPVNTAIRYRMIGVDRGWVTVNRERRAAYMNLAPGHYRFEVIAANPDGRWNTRGAAADIIVPARFYQTWWFLVLCIVAAGILVIMTFRWRVTAVTRQLRARAAERADERGRIARELHDTLLQSVQGLVLMFHSVAKRMGTSDPNHEALERTLRQADDVIAEGRSRVLDLRSADQAVRVAELVDAVAKRTTFPDDMSLASSFDGPDIMLRSDTAHEIEEIVGEALFNAARHSRGTHVKIDVLVSRRRIVITVMDDGIGLGDSTTPSREHGGFGLIGMRERARWIGGDLVVAGVEGVGTRVCLTIPMRRARFDRPGVRGQTGATGWLSGLRIWQRLFKNRS